MPRLLFASFTNVFAWMGFGTVAMKFVPVGEGALIVYTMPIWATLLAWPLAGIRPKLVDIAALVLGVGGIAVLLGGNGFSFDGGRIIGIVLLFSAAILFAIGNILNRVPLPMPPLVVVAWQVGLGCLAMLILGVAFEQPNYGALTAQGFACFVYMTLVPMGALLSHLVRDPAPPAAVIGLDRHAAGPADRRDLGGADSGRTARHA